MPESEKYFLENLPRVQPGRIATFYSYKGGVGRSFALANIAVLLARLEKRVLVVDFDLEAPGIERYFRQYLSGSSEVRQGASDRGLLHLLISQMQHAPLDWRELTERITLMPTAALGPLTGTIHLLTSGSRDPEYATLLQQFSWADFFREHDGAEFFERLRYDWVSAKSPSLEFDLILLDSRTGLTDHGSICTILLPDFLVLCFTTSKQSLDGIADVSGSIQARRKVLPYPRSPATLLPLLCRFDGREEYDEGQKWLDIISDRLKECYANWLPTRYSARRMIEATKLPYVAKFSFGEPLPVLEQGTTDPEGIGFYLDASARLLASDFSQAAAILEPATETSLAQEAERTRGGSQRKHVFVSYAYNDASHVQRVRKLVERLRSQGIPILSDYSFLETHPGGPDEGWSRWIMDQVERSACILIIGSKRWFDSYKGQSEPYAGLGAASEAGVIRRLAYSERAQNRFRLALIDSTDLDEVPLDLRSWHIFRPLDSESDFENLQRWLRSKLGIAEPRETREILWPSPSSSFEPNIVNRRNEWRLLTSLCAGALSPPIISIVGPGGIGKTSLVSELRRYAAVIGLPFLFIRCSIGGDTWREISAGLSQIAPEVGSSGSPTELRQRLRLMNTPLILAFDDYEAATGEERAEIIQPLVEESELCPAVGLIISGREVMLTKGTRIMLDSLKDVGEWYAWALRAGLELERQHIETLVRAADGNPTLIQSLVNALAVEVGKETPR